MYQYQKCTNLWIEFDWFGNQTHTQLNSVEHNETQSTDWFDWVRLNLISKRSVDYAGIQTKNRYKRYVFIGGGGVVQRGIGNSVHVLSFSLFLFSKPLPYMRLIKFNCTS